jgi:hypothetical protein
MQLLLAITALYVAAAEFAKRIFYARMDRRAAHA